MSTLLDRDVACRSPCFGEGRGCTPGCQLPTPGLHEKGGQRVPEPSVPCPRPSSHNPPLPHTPTPSYVRCARRGRSQRWELDRDHPRPSQSAPGHTGCRRSDRLSRRATLVRRAGALRWRRGMSIGQKRTIVLSRDIQDHRGVTVTWRLSRRCASPGRRCLRSCRLGPTPGTLGSALLSSRS